MVLMVRSEPERASRREEQHLTRPSLWRGKDESIRLNLVASRDEHQNNSGCRTHGLIPSCQTTRGPQERDASTGQSNPIAKLNTRIYT